MSIFEIIMLLCFGAAWPISIYRSFKSKSTKGKSLFFLFVVEVGYVMGILNKIYYHYDNVVYLYGLNFVLILVDIVLWFRNKAIEKREN